MGLGGSKEKVKEADDFDIYVFDQKNITYDENGNLVYQGLDAKGSETSDREREAKFIMEIEWKEQEEAAKAAAAVAKMATELALPNDEEKAAELLPESLPKPDGTGAGHNHDHAKQEPEDCYIMDSPWVESWLHYVHINKDSPRPGPCRNHRLIVWDKVSEKWVGRPGLQMAVKLRAGDYRRVSKATWEAYMNFYPSSGPTIKMVYVMDPTLVDTGLYDTSSWEITWEGVSLPPGPDQKKKKNAEPRALISGLGSTPAKAGYDERKDNDDGDKRTSNEGTGDDVSLLTLTKKQDPSSPSGASGNKAAEPKSPGGGSYSQVDDKKPTARLTIATDSTAPGERESFFSRVFFGDGGGVGGGGSSATRPMAKAADVDSDDDM